MQASPRDIEPVEAARAEMEPHLLIVDDDREKSYLPRDLIVAIDAALRARRQSRVPLTEGAEK